MSGTTPEGKAVKEGYLVACARLVEAKANVRIKVTARGLFVPVGASEADELAYEIALVQLEDECGVDAARAAQATARCALIDWMIVAVAELQPQRIDVVLAAFERAKTSVVQQKKLAQIALRFSGR